MKILTDDNFAFAIENNCFVESEVDRKKQPKIQDLYLKLNKYEKLEEEIGCPLDVIIKAMTSEIYYDIISGTGIIVQPFLVVNDDGMFVFDTMGETDYIFLNDYKKTWWLKKDRSE